MKPFVIAYWNMSDPWYWMMHMLVLQEDIMQETKQCKKNYRMDRGVVPCMQMPEIIVAAVISPKELENYHAKIRCLYFHK